MKKPIEINGHDATTEEIWLLKFMLRICMPYMDINTVTMIPEVDVSYQLSIDNLRVIIPVPRYHKVIVSCASDVWTLIQLWEKQDASEALEATPIVGLA